MAKQTIKVNKNQNLMDICLQVYGTTQQLFKLAKDNNLSIDSSISIGDYLTYDDDYGNTLVLEIIVSNNLSMINPGSSGSTSVDYWTDGLGTIFTDGLDNKFTDI